MNLPNPLARLVATQNSFDSVAYAQCFSETAVVFDEGKTHRGRAAVQDWIAEANEKYKATMKPVGFEEKGAESILKAEISGNFPGSPLVLSYHLVIADELIQSLKITG